MNSNQRLIMTMALGVFIIASTAFCGWLTVKPLEKNSDSEISKNTLDPNVVFRFFDEDFVSGGYAYWYPDKGNVFIPEESGKNGEVALEFELDAQDYSGGSVCLYNLLYDLTPNIATGALQFWIKGNQGGEIAWVALVDDENSDGKKTVVRLPLENYGGITNEWRKVEVPLVDFGTTGVYWDPKQRLEIPEPFTWESVTEFRCEIKQMENSSFKVWIDDIFIVKNITSQ